GTTLTAPFHGPRRGRRWLVFAIGPGGADPAGLGTCGAVDDARPGSREPGDGLPADALARRRELRRRDARRDLPAARYDRRQRPRAMAAGIRRAGPRGRG